jgi:hypothetical protein
MEWAHFGSAFASSDHRQGWSAEAGRAANGDTDDPVMKPQCADVPESPHILALGHSASQVAEPQRNRSHGWAL